MRNRGSKEILTERPNNSDASKDLEVSTIAAYFASQESTFSGNVEYYAVELSVASFVDPHLTEGASATSVSNKT